MAIDGERPYWGHQIEVSAVMWISHPGAAVWSASSRVERAQLDRGQADAASTTADKVPLGHALAEALGLEWWEGDELAGAQYEELASDDGLVYGHVFDFSSLDLDEDLRERLGRTAPELRLAVGPAFLERVIMGERQPRRHFIHGDQSESDPTKYFCRSCDGFMDAGHFLAEHDDDLEEKYFSELTWWQQRPARFRLQARRSPRATNYLAGIAAAGRAQREAERSLGIPAHRDRSFRPIVTGHSGPT